MTLKVSIITPCFNGVATIEDCVNSIRNQNYPNIEHIVVDGGSFDGTQKLLDALGVAYISGPDAGIYDAINKGLALASGEIIGILNSDDFYAHNDVIGSVVSCFEREICDFVHGKIVQIDDDGKHVWTVGENVSHAQLLKKMRVAHPSVFLKRDVYQALGNFSVGFRIAGDYDFVLRVFPKCKISFMDQVMVMMRMGGVSSVYTKKSLCESMAVQIVHGAPPAYALLNYYKSIAVHALVQKLRAFGIVR